MTTVKVRHVREDDLPEIVRIEKYSFTNAYSEKLLALLATTKQGEFLVAVEDGRIVGYISAVIHGRASSIVSIAVHPEFRNKRVGKILLETLIRNLKGKKVSSVNLEMRESNVAAKNLYKPFGFKNLCKIPHYYENGEDAEVLYLSLKDRIRLGETENT